MSAASPNARGARATFSFVEVAGNRAAGVDRLLARCDHVVAARAAGRPPRAP